MHGIDTLKRINEAARRSGQTQPAASAPGGERIAVQRRAKSGQMVTVYEPVKAK